MRILYVCKSLPHSFQGGIQTHVWKLSEYMIRLGHDVTILTAGSWRKGENQYDLDGRHIIEIPYLPMRRQPVLSLFLEEMSFNIAAKKWLLQHVASRTTNSDSGYDIVHLQGRSGSGFPSEFSPLPIITTFHGLLSIENKKAGKTGIQKYLHEEWASVFEKNALKNSDAIIAVSKEMQRQLIAIQSMEASKVTVLPNGVDIQKDVQIEQKSSGSLKTLLFVGRLDRIKGVHNLLESMKTVSSDIRLVIIGDGPERRNIENIANVMIEDNTELVGRIEILGAMANDKVMEKVKQCDALILPSFHETQGIVLMEANACGKPVIASFIEGVKEVVTHGYNGLLCNPYNPEQISDAINRLFSNPDLMIEMGKNGRELVAQKFDWTIIARQTERLYARTIQAFNAEKEPMIEENSLISRPQLLKTQW